MTLLAVSTFVWVFILVPLIVVWAIAVVDIFRRPLSLMATATWIVVVLVFPFIGTLVYFIFRRPTQEEIRQRATAAELLDAEHRGDVGPRPPID
jgi:phospholipase D-like protein